MKKILIFQLAKKKTGVIFSFILLFSCGLSLRGYGQNIYKDARRLAKMLRSNVFYLEVSSDETAKVIVNPKAADSKLAYTYIPKSKKDLPLELGQTYVVVCRERQELEIQFWQGKDTSSGYFSVEEPGLLFFNNPGNISISNPYDTSFEKRLDTFWIKPNYVEMYGRLAIYAGEDDLENPPLPGFLNAFYSNPYLRDLPDQLRLYSPNEQALAQLKRLIHNEIRRLLNERSRERDRYRLDPLDQENLLPANAPLSFIDIHQSYQTYFSDTAALENLAVNLTITQERLSKDKPPPVFITDSSEVGANNLKEKYALIFLESFKEHLESILELKILFPASNRFFNNINITAPTYQALLISAREAFAKDFKQMGNNFARLLEHQEYRELNHDPFVYSLRSLYYISELIYRDIPLDTSFALLYKKLNSQQSEIEKELNLDLARKFNSDKEIQLGLDLQALAEKMKDFQKQLNEAYFMVLESESDLYIDSYAKIDSIKEEGAKQRLNNIFLEAQKKLAPLQLEYSHALDSFGQTYHHLQGRLDYDYLLKTATVNKFNRYFNQVPDRIALTGAGLAVTRAYVASGEGKSNKALLLKKWAQVLQETREKFNYALNQIRGNNNTDLEIKVDNLKKKQAEMERLLEEEIKFWRELPPDKESWNKEYNLYGLEYIKNALASLANIELEQDNLADIVQNRRQTLDKAASLIEQELKRMQEEWSGDPPNSPLRDFFNSSNINDDASTSSSLSLPLADVQFLIDQAGEINKDLKDLENQFSPELSLTRDNVHMTFKVVELSAYLLKFFKLNEPDPKWLTLEHLNSLIQDEFNFKIFQGLIYQQLDHLEIFRGIPPSEFTSMIAIIVNALDQVNVQKLSLYALQERKESPGLQDYRPFLAATTIILNEILETPLILDRSKGKKDHRPLTSIYPNALGKTPDIFRELSSLFNNIGEEKYELAISNVTRLLKILKKGDCKKGLDLEWRMCKQHEKNLNDLSTYGNFMAYVLKATETGHIQQALERATPSPRSHRIKREADFNISLNAYAGGACGVENSGTLVNSFPIVSLSVPVGLAMSFKLGRRYQNQSSGSLFFPIIDVGTFTALRLGPYEIESLPELKLSNFIAPGLLLYYNMGAAPLYMGTGFQFGPDRRATFGGQNTVRAFRLLFQFGVDLPISNFYIGK